MDQQREMTLDEWVDRLPESHVARRELTDLRSQLAAANEAVRVLGEEVKDWGEALQAEYRDRGSEYDWRNHIGKAVLNNPLARASVEKAGKA